MTTLHAFGCSITQGFSLPDIINPILGDDGQPLTDQQIEQQGIQGHWEDLHILKPSAHAWPAVLAEMLDIPVVNHARRGACFNQIARQCAVAAPQLRSDDVVIVMWTYLSRLSLQWPARTTVPFCNIVDPNWGWRTVRLGFNRFFGLSDANKHTDDSSLQQFIERSSKHTYLDPRSIYDRYYNSLVLQVMTDGFLRATGASVIHLSVEPESYLSQLEQARSELEPSLREPYVIPDPKTWYDLRVDHDSCHVIHDPSLPLAVNGMHPGLEHHINFAQQIYQRYLS